MNAIVLQTQNLTIGYQTRSVLADTHVSLRAGQLVCLIGPNGAGKSTLMRTLAGMQPPLKGSIQIQGSDLHRLSPLERAQRLSIVLTERVEVGLLAVESLVALGRHPYTDWSGRLSATDTAVVDEALRLVGAADLRHRPLLELSDGERQKVMIARALAQEPAVMLLDEPTAFLDAPRRAEIMGMLRRLTRDTGRAILLSTHDLDLALRHADRIWLLPRGGPLQVGAPEDLILSGAFAAAFQGEGVAFDAYTGSFHTIQAASGIISLSGEGPAALWTQRALERAGYCVQPNQPDAPLSVTLHPGEWHLHHDSQHHIYGSLAALIDALETNSAAATHPDQ
jgi:iron complex transport system ATP-binding protein